MTDKRNVGVLLVPTFLGDLAYGDFLQPTFPDPENRHWISVICHESAYGAKLDILYSQFIRLPYQFHLFALPSDIPPQNLQIGSIEYPISIQGCVLTMTTKTVEGLIEECDKEGKPNFDEMMKQPFMGGAAWITSHNLPFIAAIEHQAFAQLSQDTLRERCYIERDAPIISFQAQFELDDVGVALSALWERIKASNPSLG